MSKLKEKLRSAQYELKAPKGQFNSFGKYNYRSSEDILEAVKPINHKFDLTLTLSDKPVLIGDWHYIEATATLSDGEEELLVTAYARESETKKGMDDSQITGTASSYARKYALNGLYLIDDTKDADTDEHAEQAKKPSKTNTSKTNKNEDAEDQFFKNKSELEKRITAVSVKTGKNYKALEAYVIKASNDKLKKEYKNINSQNIGTAAGYVKAMELKADRDANTNNEQQSMMQGTTTNPVEWGK